MLEWIHDNEELAGWLFGLSVLTFLGSLIAIPVLVARIPADYFVRKEPGPASFGGRHPAIRLTLRIVKNTFGVIFILAGATMLLLPGQGLLTIFVGIVLLDFPGKRRLESALIRKRPVLRAVNWMRRRWRRPPLQFPDGVDPPDDDDPEPE